MISFMIKQKPFMSQLQQVIAVSDEFTIIFGVLLLYWMYTSNGDLSKMNMIAFAIIGTVVLSLFKNMTIIVYKSITQSYSRFREWWFKKFKVRRLRRQRINKEKAEKEKQEKEKEELSKILAKESKLKDLVTNLQSLQPGNSIKVTLDMPNSTSKPDGSTSLAPIQPKVNSHFLII